ncbi:unnamed protein product, partial [Didymodactylos carnosus]
MPQQLWLWIRDWLQGRKACISFDGLQSDFFDIEWGLPQGSALSPLIYIPYVAGLTELHDARFHKDHFFADDWSLFFEVPFGI